MDYDYKKKRLGKIPDEEVKQAVEKFEESKELAERSMFNFLENDVSASSCLPSLSMQDFSVRDKRERCSALTPCFMNCGLGSGF